MWQMVEVVGTGFGLVMSVLAILWGATILLSRLARPRPTSTGPASSLPDATGDREPLTDGSPDASVSASASTASPVSSSGMAPDAPLAPDHLVAIAAAVAMVLERPHRILHVHAPEPDAPVWAQEGRVEQFNSHRMRSTWNRSESPAVHIKTPERN